ncbi:unnamed protein product [Phytomonas sp. EM1]|nr:unnamed protein product [Phytomonas sp. EM1]|eukprot:CCW62421.1 unnamed protein product [Phytomonas sp. isolate EM1]
MVSPNLFAHCDDALCVAEDNAVAFFASKTLKKFREERFTGARLCGLYTQPSSDGKQNTLHVMDVEANWYVLSIKPVAVKFSTTICLQSDSVPSASAAAGRSHGASSKRSKTVPAEVTSNGIHEVHFYERMGHLYAILLTDRAVYEVALKLDSNVSAVKIISLPTAMPDCFAAVGAHTGLVVVAQRAQRWLQFSLPKDREDVAVACTSHRRVLPISIQSMACSPTSEAIALGGCRGELVVFPDANNTHFFSDHWHHTPLTALSFSVDGSTLYTGAHESILLVWDTTSYTHRKITCDIGTIHCVVPSVSTGSRLLLVCNTATLATVSLLNMTLEVCVEGIEWASSEAYSGLVVDRWMGQPAVIVTGLPNVLRICDPMTQQAVYSLHISSQQETIPMMPRHGIRHAGLLGNGRVLVTYESFTPTSLPPLLRFWSYEASKKRHEEAQTIYKPHDGEIFALRVDKKNQRVFTLARESVKCWEEVFEDANDAIATAHRSWRNQSTNPTPTFNVSDMILSTDGTLCFLADDCVHVYAVAECRAGEPWTKICCLVQNSSTEPLRHLLLNETTRVVAAHDGMHVFLWDLASPKRSNACCVIPSTSASTTITALCQFTPHSLLVACEDRSLVEISCDPLNSFGNSLGVIKSTISSRILHMVSLSSEVFTDEKERQVAVVDDVSGFRVINVSMPRRKLEEARFTEDATRSAEAHRAADGDKKMVGTYFRDDVVWQQANPGSEGDVLDSLTKTNRIKKVNTWLRNVLQEPSYTVPSMASVLSLYLRQQNGLG